MLQPRTRWLKGWALKYPPHPHKTKGKISKACIFLRYPHRGRAEKNTYFFASHFSAEPLCFFIKLYFSIVSWNLRNNLYKNKVIVHIHIYCKVLFRLFYFEKKAYLKQWFSYELTCSLYQYQFTKHKNFLKNMCY